MGCERVDAWGALVPSLAPGPLEKKEISHPPTLNPTAGGRGGGLCVDFPSLVWVGDPRGGVCCVQSGLTRLTNFQMCVASFLHHLIRYPLLFS